MFKKLNSLHLKCLNMCSLHFITWTCAFFKFILNNIDLFIVFWLNRETIHCACSLSRLEQAKHSVEHLWVLSPFASCFAYHVAPRLNQSGKFTLGFEVGPGTTSCQQSSLEGAELQPHIKAPINPRPQLPQMPQLSLSLALSLSVSHTRVCTHTAQPQPDQNRADHGHATNLTDPTGLST